MRLVKKIDTSTGQEILGEVEINNTNLTPKEIVFNNVDYIDVTHYRGYEPVVQVKDLNKNVIDCNINHLNDGQFEIKFDYPMSGKITYN